ncbi:MAG: hypothetical protein WCV59_01700 [Parcubacteria group bacterium]|jgi:hypothetical protein
METLQKKSLFWDVEEIDPERNERFVIERVLNFGDEEDFKWAIKYYSRGKIIKNLLDIKSLTKKSLLFWCKYFNINEKKCSIKQSTKKQSAFLKR